MSSPIEATGTDSQIVRAPADHIRRRFGVAVIASLVLNAAFWPLAARLVRWRRAAAPEPITVTLLAPPPHRDVPEPRSPPAVAPPKHVARPVLRPAPIVPAPPARSHAQQPPPEQAHNRVLIALPDRHPGTDGPTALPGGDAPVGVPISDQRAGPGAANVPETTPAPPTPQPPPATPQPAMPTPAPTPPAWPLAAPADAPPKPAGPTRDATVTNQVEPEIPDELRSASFTASVHVQVEIRADGSFTPKLNSSSGNAEIDRYVLEALRQWKWKPALKDGVAIVSVKYFRFDFEVN